MNDLEFSESVKNNLYEGLVVNNYRSLCQLLGLTESSGRTKVGQINRLKRFCNFERDGQKYIIKDIYNNSDIKAPGNREVYVRFIENILLNYLVKNTTPENPKCYFSKKKLWEILGLCNSKFSRLNDHIGLKAINPDITKWHIDMFYTNACKKFNGIIMRSLDSISERKYFKYSIATICREENGGYVEITDEHDLNVIVSCERKALEKIRGSDAMMIFNKMSYKSYKNLASIFIKEALGYEYSFNVYSIVCGEKIYSIDKQPDDILISKELLNAKVAEVLIGKCESDYKKNQEDYNSGKTQFKYPANYVEVQSSIIDALIRINKETLEEISLDDDLDDIFM